VASAGSSITHSALIDTAGGDDPIGVQAVAPAGDSVPTGHALHDACPESGWKEFAGQYCTNDDPVVDVNDPGGAGEQAAALLVLE
jgi:hypothetical protein